jgi:hypothetical protein
LQTPAPIGRRLVHPAYHCTVLLLAAVIALTVSDRSAAAAPLTPSRASGAASAKSPDIRLELRCERSGDLVASIQNAGTADTALIFGSVLGNGAKYLVAHLSLSIHGDGQTDYFRMYRPKDYPARVGGTLDDWIVPLPVGTSFSLRLRPADFEGWRDLTTLPASTVAVRLEVRGPSRSSSAYSHLFRVWADRDALVSNAVHVPVDCQ